MVWIISFFTLLGFNFTFWLLVGLIRYIHEKITIKKEKYIGTELFPINISDVAAVIPAHNEEASIKSTIKGLLKVLPKKNIYIASDNSTDKTIDIIREMGIRSLDIRPNKGKARALVHIMKEYRLLDAYKAILINDADSIIDPNYIPEALKKFRDPSIAAVTPHGVTMKRKLSFRQGYYQAYRIKLWRIIQTGMRFGQTWKFTNVSYIIPGSYSIYRTSVLRQLEIDAPGLIIEDFNMTFEVHKKKLGKIAYCPNVYGTHQDPYSLRDYIKQVKRWNVGFFQTVNRNGVWPSLFWLATGSFLLELTLYAAFVIFTPLLLISFFIKGFDPLVLPYIYDRLTFLDLMIGLFLMDYISTVVAAIIERRPSLLIYGLGFIFLRYIDSVIYITSIPIAFLTKSSGIWESPKRVAIAST